MSSFGLYMIGIVIVVSALSYGAYLLGLETRWIVIGALLIVGLGVMGAVSKTRRRDPSQGD